MKNVKGGLSYEPFGLHNLSAFKPRQGLLDPEVEELLQ